MWGVETKAKSLGVGRQARISPWQGRENFPRMKILAITKGLSLKLWLTPRVLLKKRTEAEGQARLKGAGATAELYRCGYFHQPGQWQSRGKRNQCPHGFCTQVTKRMMVRLWAQAEFSWEHQILLQKKIRTVSQNARRAFPNAYMKSLYHCEHCYQQQQQVKKLYEERQKQLNYKIYNNEFTSTQKNMQSIQVD